MSAMEWEVGVIEQIQKTLGSLNGSVGTVLSFIGGEMGLMMVLLIILFCWKKETGKPCHRITLRPLFRDL